MSNTITVHDPASGRGVRENLPALLSLGLASCLAVTTEVLPVGLLPAIGNAFGVGDSTTGWLVTVYAAMVAFFSVPLTIATRRLPRKPIIAATVLAYLISNIVIATAPTFAIVGLGRVVGGGAHALFFAVCIGYVPRLVDRGQVGRGLAVVSAGATAGFVLGVPLSTTLGSAIGWRNAFLTLAAVAVVTLVSILRFLPAVAGAAAGRANETRGARVDLGLVVSSNALTFIGQYTLYTYISVVFLAAGASESSVGPLLLLCGLCGLVGLWCTGRTIDRRPRATVLAVLALLAATILAVGLSHAWFIPIVITVALWNGVFGGVPSIYQAAAVRTTRDAPEIAGAWVNATANIGIALGALIGGRLLDASSDTMPMASVGAALVAVGLGVVVVGRRAFPSGARTH